MANDMFYIPLRSWPGTRVSHLVYNGTFAIRRVMSVEFREPRAQPEDLTEHLY